MILISFLFIGYWVAYAFWKICQVLVSPFRRDDEVNWPVHLLFALGMLSCAYAVHLRIGNGDQNQAGEYFMEFCAVTGAIGALMFLASFVGRGLEKLMDRL